MESSIYLVELLKARLSSGSFAPQIIKVGGRLPPGQVVEVGGAASVEAIGEVLKEGRPSRTKVCLKALKGLRSVDYFLAQDSGQIRGNLVHVLRLGSGYVVELVAVPGRAFYETHHSCLCDVVCADKRVASAAERIREPALLVNVVAVRLQQVVHEKIGSEDSDGEAGVDEGLLAPPVVLEHDGDGGPVPADVLVRVVAGGVGVRPHAGDPHHVLHLPLQAAQVLGEVEVVLQKWVQGCAVYRLHSSQSGTPGALVCQVKFDHLVCANLLQVVALCRVVHGSPHSESDRTRFVKGKLNIGSELFQSKENSDVG